MFSSVIDGCFNRLNFGFDSSRGISLDYAESGMDRGLADFSIQLPVVSTRSDISLPSCVSTNVFSQPLSTFESKKSVLIPNISEKSSIGIACFQV